MLDIKRIVEDTQAVKQALLKRMSEEKLNLDKIIDLYNKKKEVQKEFEQKRSSQNSFNSKMAQTEKGSDEFMSLVKDLKELSSEVKELEEKVRELDQDLNEELSVLPNIPDEDVVAGGPENNVVIKTVGEKPTFDFEIKDHVELATSLGLIDYERGAKIAGNGFWIYTNLGARLEWALLNYFIEEHIKDGYEFILPPHILTERSGYVAGQFPKFKDDVYTLKSQEESSQFLLPTSETALINLHRDEILTEDQLPKKYFSYTPCYRKEAGSYRSEERGMVRGHQFNKVEMFQFTKPEDSDKAFGELVDKAERLLTNLGLHFQISKLAAGDCSAGMARTYDPELWIPSMNMYKEASSVSNARDYQARRGNMKFRRKETNQTEYLHTLNGSGLATSRLFPAILEQNQQADGSVVIPEILRKYMGVDKIEAK